MREASAIAYIVVVRWIGVELKAGLGTFRNLYTVVIRWIGSEYVIDSATFRGALRKPLHSCNRMDWGVAPHRFANYFFEREPLPAIAAKAGL